MTLHNKNSTNNLIPDLVLILQKLKFFRNAFCYKYHREKNMATKFYVKK